MWPVHTWLPDAHVEAQSDRSIIATFKNGWLWFYKVFSWTASVASEYFSNLVFILHNINDTSLVALMQEDMKKLIAYPRSNMDL